MGTGVGEFRQLREVRVFSYLVISYLKSHEMVLGVVRSGRAMDFSPKKWNRGLMRGLPMDSPRTSLGLLKTVRIAC